MKEVDETIEFMEKKLQELKKFKQESEEQADKEDMIEQRLENIEKNTDKIKKAIIE